LSNVLPDTLKYTSWSEDNGDSHFASDYHRAQEDRNNDVTTTHANGDRNDATHRFDRLARGLRISDQLSDLNDIEPFPPYENVYHLSQDDMNLGSAHSFGDGNEATRPFSRLSDDQLTGFKDRKLDTLDERNSLHGSQSSEHAATRRVAGAVAFGDCTFSVDPSGLLTRYGSCPTQSGSLTLSGMSIKALAPDVFSNLSSVR